MRKIALIAFIIILPLVTFCQRSVHYKRVEQKIKTVLVLAPVSEVFVIKLGNDLEKDSAHSITAYRNMANQLQKSIPKYVNKYYFKSDSVTRSTIIKLVIDANNRIGNNNQAGRYRLPDSIVKLFDTASYSYVLCTYNGGFIRDRKNLVNQHLGNQVMDFLIGFGSKPLASASTVSCFVIDLKQKNLAYFQRIISVNENLLETKAMINDLKKIIDTVFVEEETTPITQ